MESGSRLMDRRERDLLNNLRLRDIDFHLRRIQNAADAVNPRDYVTLQQLEKRLLSIDVIGTSGVPGIPGPPGTSSLTPWITITPTVTSVVIDHALGDRFTIIVNRDIVVTTTNLQNNHELRLRFKVDGTDRSIDLTALPLPSVNNFPVGLANSILTWDGDVIGGVLECSAFNPLL